MNVRITATNGSKVSNVTVGGRSRGTIHLLNHDGMPLCAVGFWRRLWFRWAGFVTSRRRKQANCVKCIGSLPTAAR